jgi:hypothetical protein
VGIRSDTATFSVATIRSWWENEGKICLGTTTTQECNFFRQNDIPNKKGIQIKKQVLRKEASCRNFAQ